RPAGARRDDRPGLARRRRLHVQEIDQRSRGDPFWRARTAGVPGLLQAWIERVAKTVTEQIEAEHGDEDGDSREERGRRVGVEERDVGLEIPPPARRRRLGAQPEK